MGALEVFAGTTSVLTRITAFAFLRIIPGHIGTYCRWLFLASAVGLYLINRKLRFIEEETSRTMHAEQARYIENGNGSEQQTSPSSPYGKSSKKQHKKNKPSYAEIAAKGAAAAKDTAVVQEHQGGGAGTGTGTGADAGQAATRRPPTSHLARDVGVPSRPGYLHLLFGLPSSSRRGNWLAIVINAGLLAMALDFQYTPLLGKNVHDTTFIRVGAVADTSVKLVARLPPSLFAPTAAPAHFHAARRAAALDSAGHAGDRHALSHETPDAVNIVYRPVKPHGAWLFGGSVAAGAETDYVGVLKLESLLPGTEYEYAMVLPDAQAHRHVAPSVAHPHYFRTAPDPRLSVRQTHFTFAASSCIKPNWPYVPGKDHLSIRGAAELAEHIVPKSIDFALLLGDFIYADVPSRIANAAGYAKKYRQNYASRDWRRVYEAIPVLGIWDDHEIVNDYAGQGNDSQPYFEMANSAYSAYVGSANPDPIVPGAHYYTFDHGDVSFFVMDTRRYRSANEATDDEQKTMLGDEQKMHFVQWLADKNQTATWKFVVSSVPFLTNWAGPNGQFDTWGGFQTERTELMDIMEYVPNIIFISGDRHEFAAAIIREKVLDFSISPLNQFYLPIRTLSQKYGRGSTGEDRVLKYIPDGSRKFGTFEVDTRPARPTVVFKLYVDGEEAWSLDVVGQPIHRPTPPASLGRNLAMSLSELLGFGSRRWF